MKFLFDKRKGKITVFDKGLYSGIKREPSVRIIFIFLIIGIVLAQKYENDFNMKVILIGSLLLIFVTEIINTSIEDSFIYCRDNKKQISIKDCYLVTRYDKTNENNMLVTVYLEYSGENNMIFILGYTDIKDFD